MNKKIAKVFRGALRHLWDGNGPMRGKSEYICYAIGRHTNVQIEARRIVMERIAPYSTLDDWLLFRFDVAWAPQRDLQEHRRQWLLRLIEEFS